MIAIVGPTATGKTLTGIELAKMINGEIISADSRQIYKYLSIGTAKPKGMWLDTVYVTNGVPYHLVDFLSPDKNFSAGDFVKLAKSHIKQIKGRKKTPIIVGGTGLYINSLINGIAKLPARNDSLREKLLLAEKKHGRGHLYKILMKIDPDIASKIHPNNIHRIIRALEVYKLTGIPISKWHKTQKKENNDEWLIFGLTCARDELYKRINNRVEEMLKDGLMEETKALLESSYSENSPGLQSIGYRYVVQYLKNKISYNEMVSQIKQDTRHYAKRQLTWFKKTRNINWIDCSKFTPVEIAQKLWKKL